MKLNVRLYAICDTLFFWRGSIVHNFTVLETVNFLKSMQKFMPMNIHKTTVPEFSFHMFFFFTNML